jgi:20S proteasome subunit beta 1
MIVCGWDPTDGAQIYTVGMGGTMTKQRFAMSGSGSYVINGFVDTHYRDNMTKQQAEDFVVKGK